MKARRLQRIALGLALGLCVALVAAAALKRRFPHSTARGAWRDLRAAVAARKATNTVERFLELRYGPLTNAINREAAFLHFFDRGHIEAMQWAVAHMDPELRRTNIIAAAEWIAHYRNGLSELDKASLRERLASAAGQQQLRQATQQYLGQDVAYRSATAPVIIELMMTLDSVKHP